LCRHSKKETAKKGFWTLAAAGAADAASRKTKPRPKSLSRLVKDTFERCSMWRTLHNLCRGRA